MHLLWGFTLEVLYIYFTAKMTNTFVMEEMLQVLDDLKA